MVLVRSRWSLIDRLLGNQKDPEGGPGVERGHANAITMVGGGWVTHGAHMNSHNAIMSQIYLHVKLIIVNYRVVTVLLGLRLGLMLPTGRVAYGCHAAPVQLPTSSC